jgi:hypothetical protein
MMTNRAVLGALFGLLLGGSAIADDAEVAKALKEGGATVVVTKGLVTRLEVGDCSKWTEEDFRRVGGLSGLKDLSVGAGLTDATLALLCGLPELEVLQTNQSQVTDEGMKALAGLKKLKTLKLFHPGKAFSGVGLLHLKELPVLERLTVAGSLSFGDEGMAAAAKLVHLKELRTWHAGHTLDGVRSLRELRELKSLTLGQRLAYKPPTSLSDETLAVLADLTSLESLRLEEARLKGESLLQLKKLAGLKSLTLEGIDIAEADVDLLRKELPGVDVKWTRPNETYQKRIQALFGKE